MRKLSLNETQFIEKMLSYVDIPYKLPMPLSEIFVQELNDGGMGSLEFIRETNDTRVFWKAILEANTYDIDNVIIMLELSIDSLVFLYQLDSFKGDFSPLKKPFSLDNSLENICKLSSRDYENRF